MKELRLTDWLPTTKKEIELRGWDNVDVILFSADAYVDHPSFGAAVIGRTLEYAGYPTGMETSATSRNSVVLISSLVLHLVVWTQWLTNIRQASVFAQKMLIVRMDVTTVVLSIPPLFILRF